MSLNCFLHLLNLFIYQVVVNNHIYNSCFIFLTCIFMVDKSLQSFYPFFYVLQAFFSFINYSLIKFKHFTINMFIMDCCPGFFFIRFRRRTYSVDFR